MKLTKKGKRAGLILWTKEIRALEIHSNQIIFTSVREDGEISTETEPMSPNIKYLVQEEKKGSEES